MSWLSNLLAHPATRGMPLDSASTTMTRRQILAGKPFLRAIYCEWYQRILRGKRKDAKILEIGSGAGFLKTLFPEVISSEILRVDGVDLVADCQSLPFGDGSLDAIIMVDVFHHIPDVALFLSEATRCVRTGGRVDMIEPWSTPWARWVYRTLHSEPFEPEAGWTIPGQGPLSGANGALPWIVFQRDSARMARDFPMWKVDTLEPIMPFSYLLSGGISTRLGFPAITFNFCRRLEAALHEKNWAMFAHIGLARV